MQGVRKSHILLILLMVFSCARVAWADISLEASLSNLSFPVDQGTILTITVNGASRISAIEFPEIAGITFQGRGQSSRINIINGSMTSSLANNYLIQAQKPGIYTIPPIKVTAGSDVATTKPMSFEVTGSARGNSTNNSAGAERSPQEIAFIRVTALADHYPGEIVPVQIKAYFNPKYRPDISSLPTIHGDGVVMLPLREKLIKTEEIVNNIQYIVASWNTTLTGIKVGRHPLTFSMEAVILTPQKKRPSSPFGGGPFDDSVFNDPFFDSVFSNVQRKPIDVVSPEVVLNVIPLPTANQPKDFNGAIGDFTLKVTANRQNLEVGEPLKLSMEIAGSGNFDRVEAPAFTDSPDWKTYTPTANFTSQGNSYTGAKVFDQAIVAKNDGVKAIPGLSFSYFDPVKKEYITRTSPPIAVALTKSATAAAPTQPAQNAAVAPPKQTAQPDATAPDKTGHGFEQMAPINVQIGNFQQKIVPLFMRPWFLGVVILCILVLAALFLWQLRHKHLEKHPEKKLQRQKADLFARDMQGVEQAFKAGKSNDFLFSCRTAMQNQLGLSWNMAPTAISLASLKDRLGPDAPLTEIFAATDAAAYSGATLSREKMHEYMQIMNKELEGLQ